MTGLSRRTIALLLVAAALGIVASTVATVLGTDAEPGCADADYGCAGFEPGEPILIGVAVPAGETDGLAAIRGVRLAVDLRGGTLLGRRVHLATEDDACTADAGAEAARELASDPPQEPPAVAVIGALCTDAAVPEAQILSHSGIPLLSPTATALVPQAGAPAYYLPLEPTGDRLRTLEGEYRDRFGSLPGALTGVRAALAADLVLAAAESLAADGPGGALLVPRTPLRDALIDTGLVEPLRPLRGARGGS